MAGCLSFLSPTREDELSNLLTRGEAAKRARICVRTLHTRVKDETGPRVTRIGGKVFIREDHLNEWLDSLSDQ